MMAQWHFIIGLCFEICATLEIRVFKTKPVIIEFPTLNSSQNQPPPTDLEKKQSEEEEEEITQDRTKSNNEGSYAPINN